MKYFNSQLLFENVQKFWQTLKFPKLILSKTYTHQNNS